MSVNYVNKQTVSILGKTFLISEIYELVKDRNSFRVPISRFDRDMVDASWFEDGVAPNMKEMNFHIERIMNAELKYPVIYLRDRGLLDGWHRIFKSKIQGLDYVDVVLIYEREVMGLLS